MFSGSGMYRGVAAFAAALIPCACAAPIASTHYVPAPAVVPLMLTPHVAPARRTSPIQHIVIVVQENRSFDNLFQGFPGANTQTFGFDSHGNKIALLPVGLESPFDMGHGFTTAVTDVDYPKGSAMDGFDLTHCNLPSCPPDIAYSYVPPVETKPYRSMARQYVLADDFFASDLDASFEGHQFLIAGQSEQTWGIPPLGTWGCDGGKSDQVHLLDTSTEPGTTTNTPRRACFDPPVTPSIDPTLGDELDAAGLTWRYYAPAFGQSGYLWSAYDAIKHIRRGPDWTKDVRSPETSFITDVQAGTLSNVTWVVPSFQNSDHSGIGTKSGPDWVATVVNAVGQSKKFWNSTAIFILWDDWGGWYDHAPPPLLDYDGLGIRVPLIVVSPYALGPSGSHTAITHTEYEFGSILKFAEQTFGLAPLAPSDTRATNFGADVFNFSQTPRTFAPIKVNLRPQYFLNQPRSLLPPDDE
jgi:phospholipase C